MKYLIILVVCSVIGIFFFSEIHHFLKYPIMRAIDEVKESHNIKVKIKKTEDNKKEVGKNKEGTKAVPEIVGPQLPKISELKHIKNEIEKIKKELRELKEGDSGSKRFANNELKDYDIIVYSGLTDNP
jgi:hypothetical protein